MKLASVMLLVFVGCAHHTESAATAPLNQPVPKPTVVAARDWGSTPEPIPDSRKQVPKYVTIHHAGVTWEAKVAPATFVKNMQAWGQRDKKWPDLPYHFLIAPDGTIYEGRALIYEPESNTKYELQGNIGVEMMGNFEKQRPSPQQIESCVRITAWLCDDLNIPVENIRGHKDAAPGQTDCPGKDFNRYLENGQVKEWVAAILSGKDPTIEPGAPLPDGPTQMIPTSAPTTGP